MKDLFQEASVNEVIARLETLTPESRAQWGKMNVAQAVAHCIPSMEMAVGDRRAKRMFIGRLLAPLVKSRALNEGPMRRNSPTDPLFVRSGEHDLGVEREQLKTLIRRFYAGGPVACTITPHSFFGPLTPQEWARLMYKHLDHHLQQFGV
jgi:hypothetical protein